MQSFPNKALTAGGLQIGPASDLALIALLTMKTNTKLIENFRVISHNNILEFPILFMWKR